MPHPQSIRTSGAWRAILLSFVVTLAPGCSGSSSEPATPHGTSYLPLTQGHRLEYRMMKAGGGTVGLITEVRGTRDFGGSTWSVVLTSTSDRLIHDDPTYYRVDAEGIHSGGPDGTDILFLPVDATLGSHWTARTTRETVNYTATAISDLEVEGHTYPACLQVVSESEPSGGSATPRRSSNWFAPGIGIVAYGRLTSSDPIVIGLVRHVR